MSNPVSCILTEHHYGHTNGHPLLLLHGFGGSHVWWSRIITPLAKVHPVYTLDLHYGSPIEDMVRTLLTWIQQHHVHEVSLIGHSLGALLAEHLAVQAPSTVKHLILVNPALALPERSTLAWLCACARARLINQNPPPLGTRWPPFPLRTYRMVLRALRERPLLDPIATPTLVIWGSRDPLFSPDLAPHVVSLLCSAQFVLLEGGHSLMYECPEPCSQLVLHFLASG